MFTLLGGLLGGLLRLAPEIMSWLDKKSDRSHELSMMDKQIEIDTLRSNQRVAEIESQGGITLDTAAIEALKASVQGQSQLTGIKWVDALNSTVRPFITYWWVIVLYSIALGAQYLFLVTHTTPVDAILQLWGPEEKSIVAGIINFWFLDRVIRKRNG